MLKNRSVLTRNAEAAAFIAEVSRLTGLNHVKMFREPFNPYGDGFTYNGMGKIK